MAQMCGFFDAELEGEEYDRVYLASQFAAYFASFIGNGVFGGRSDELQVIALETPAMGVQVLSGEGYINGYWYRNDSEHILSIDVADGTLPRKDAIVLRLDYGERNMYLAVLKGTPSMNPQVPALTRNADAYEIQLAVIDVVAGSVNVQQVNITDTRMDLSVCGWVTGVVQQIDTTTLFVQFQDYFNTFKNTYANDFSQWSAYQKQTFTDFVDEEKAAYNTYVQAQEKAYADFVQNSENDYDTYVSQQKAALAQYIQSVQISYNQFVSKMEADYKAWEQGAEAQFDTWYNDHIIQWTTEFNTWFDDVKGQLSEDVAGQLQNEIKDLNEEMVGYYNQTTTFSPDGKTVTQVRDGNMKIVTTFVDKLHIVQDYYTNNVKVKSKTITFSADGKVITEQKEVI